MLSTVGLNHKTTPLEVREQVAAAEADVPRMLARLAADPEITEAVLLSTCNRTEVYLSTVDRPPVERLASMLGAWRNMPVDALLPYLRVLTGEDAARHALRVAAGLESMIIGEPQILGQVRRAFGAARESGTAGPVLNRLMQVAIGCGRRVRSETGLGRSAASVPHAAMSRARSLLGTLTGRRLVVVGAGEMAELVVKVFTQAGARLTMVVNRTVAAAQALAARYGAAGVGLTELCGAIPGTDILVMSVGADRPVFTLENLDRRGGQGPLLVIDLGVPRSVPPEVHGLPGVTLYDLDELVPAGGAEVSSHDLARASDLVEDGLETFVRWLGGRSAVPVIAALHRRAEHIIDEEMYRARGRLRDLDDGQRRAVRGVVEGALRKLLHAPFVRLRGQGENARVLSLARDLFDLDETARIAEEDDS
jgi:glutamyl-tRNA reductase